MRLSMEDFNPIVVAKFFQDNRGKTPSGRTVVGLPSQFHAIRAPHSRQRQYSPCSSRRGVVCFRVSRAWARSNGGPAKDGDSEVGDFRNASQLLP